jgi:hypothetical protein
MIGCNAGSEACHGMAMRYPTFAPKCWPVLGRAAPLSHSNRPAPAPNAMPPLKTCRMRSSTSLRRVGTPHRPSDRYLHPSLPCTSSASTHPLRPVPSVDVCRNRSEARVHQTLILTNACFSTPFLLTNASIRPQSMARKGAHQVMRGWFMIYAK